jgi:hypothetical protein
MIETRKDAHMKASRFQKGSGCYTCRSCGKNTRSTGRGDNENIRLCVPCFDMSSDEKAVLDGLMTKHDFEEQYPGFTFDNWQLEMRAKNTQK